MHHSPVISPCLSVRMEQDHIGRKTFFVNFGAEYSLYLIKFDDQYNVD